MSEKIVLTVEQDECIKSMPGRGWPKEEIIERHTEGKWTDKLNESLNGLTLSQLARILYEPNSYEVERPGIKKDEWVKIIKQFKPMFNDGNNEAAYKLERIFKVTELVLGGKILCPDRYVHNAEDLRHATKEEIFWAELGREVGEFVDDDLIVTDDRNLRVVTMQGVSGSAKKLYENGSVKGFYPANSFIKLP